MGDGDVGGTAEPALAAASRRMQTWYFVDEIEYLLLTKKNPQAAERAYENFHKVVQSDPEAYERIGDSYAAFGGEEGTDRGVREWQNAHSMAGANRANVAAKLNKYYLVGGQQVPRHGEQSPARMITTCRARCARLRARWSSIAGAMKRRI